jgi:hypothetical protein
LYDDTHNVLSESQEILVVRGSSMAMKNLSDKDKREILDTVGRFLTQELEAEKVRNDLKKLVSDHIKKRKLDIDPSGLLNTIQWRVEVLLK